MKTYEITFQHEGTTFVVYVENINIESALRIFKETTHYDVVTGIREATWKV